MSNVVSLLRTRELFTKFKPLLDKLRSNMESHEAGLLKDITAYYTDLPSASAIDNKFKLWLFNVRHPNLDQVEKALYESMLDVEADDALAVTVYEKLRERAMLEKLLRVAEGCLAGEGTSSMDAVKRCVDELFTTESVEEDTNIVVPDVHGLLNKVLGDGLEWKQVWMNKSCGPLRKGNFVCLVARPDSGKTSFLCGQANTFAKQLPEGHKILWFNNEQAGSAVLLRIWQEAVEMVNADMRRDPVRVEQLYKEKVGALDKVVVVDMSTLSKWDVEEYCRKYQGQVGAIIIDQLWKVKGFGDDVSDVKTQTRISNWARELAKSVAPVIGVYQADAAAEGESYFGMDRIYLSKTAVQGEADLIVCMGRSYADGKEQIRFFQFPKNKMPGGGKYFQETMRSAKHETTFNSEIGVFK